MSGKCMSNIWHSKRGPMGPGFYQKNIIILYYLLTKSEVITGKSQTVAIMK